MRATALAALASCALAAAAGCAGEERIEGSPDPATERTDRPAEPPAGWRTFVNRRAGFSLALPREWSARTRRGATLIRSSDRLLAVTVAADRGPAGRETRPRRYAMSAFRAVPGFRRLRARETGRVRSSPYPTARVDGSGVLERRRQRQRITVAAFRRPGRVTYTVIAFGAEVDGKPVHRASLSTLLASLRARRPAL